MYILHALLLLILVCISISGKASETGFTKMDDFISTLPDAKRLDVSSSGFLDTSGYVYHAQLVQLEGKYRLQQIFIFREGSDGKYILVDQSRRMEHMGGSGSWAVQKIEFKNQSIYFSFGGHWDECVHSFTSQFKLHNGRLVMVGRESVEENNKKDLVVESSANLLTGTAYSVSGNQEAMYLIDSSKSTVKKYQFKVPKKTLPFSEFDGTPWKSPIYKDNPVC